MSLMAGAVLKTEGAQGRGPNGEALAKGVRIRLVDRLNVSDLREVSQLLDVVGMRAREPRSMRRAIASSVAIAVARFGNDRIVGFGRLIGDGVYYGSLWDVATHPSRQGEGIGSAIVERLLRVAREQKLEMVGLFTAMHNRAFYERLGFHMLDGTLPMTVRLATQPSGRRKA